MNTSKQDTRDALKALKRINDAIDVVEDEINKAYVTAIKRGKISYKNEKRMVKRQNDLQSLIEIREDIIFVSVDALESAEVSKELIQNFEEIEIELKIQKKLLKDIPNAAKSIKRARRKFSGILDNLIN